MLKSVGEDEKLCVNNPYALKGQQEQWFLTEDGLYEVLMQSRKPIAKQFKKKVKEILKGLRKGELKLVKSKEEELVLAIYHSTGIEAVNYSKQLSELKVAEATKPLLTKIENDKPLVNFAESIANNSDSIEIGIFAKLLKDEGIKMGRNKLFEWLRDNKYLMKNNIPYQNYIDNGYFEIIEYSVHTPYGDKLATKTLITGKGQIKIMEKLRNLVNE